MNVDPVCVLFDLSFAGQIVHLCQSHGLELERLDRLTAFAADPCDTSPEGIVELCIEDGSVPGLTLESASVGLFLAAKGIIEGSIEPAASLRGQVRTQGRAWFCSGPFGSPAPPVPPQVEVFVHLFRDAWQGPLDEVTWEWADRVVDRAGLMVSAALLG